MGIETIPDRASGQRMKFSWINILRSVFIGDLAPRGIAGTPRVNYGRLGSETYPWERLHLQLGHLEVGDIFHFYDYAGNVAIPQGWMWCRKDPETDQATIVGQATYDAQHSAGDWALYVGSSPLSGLYLPNTTNSYLKGKTGTLQAGSGQITQVGASFRDFSHAHGSPKTSTAPSPAAVLINTGGTSDLAFGNPGHTHSLTIPSALSASQDVRPSSTYTKILMRIV